jgi:acyl transferase domain-containing protein/NAD(P)H-dependent flavin oxidoreductase YrpB (nitropropane dioxygenase family)/acyl carrier protein
VGSHIVITPSHICDSKIAIAAIYSGETGILDLGYGSNIKNMLRSIDLLKHSAGNQKRWGIRWDTLGLSSRSPELLIKQIDKSIPTIILAGILSSDMEATLQIAHQCSPKVLLEVTTLEAAKAAQKAGFDGIILKGNEAGGYTGSESSFILLQQLNGKIDIPYWVWGGMGRHTTAAARLAGAEGAVLCEQLWLAEESPFSMEEKNLWKNMDGSETICLGDRDSFFRLYSRTGRHRIREYETLLAESDNWCSTMTQLLLDTNENMVFIPCGQDIGMASHLAETFGTTESILAAIEKSCAEHLTEAKTYCSFSKGSPLAKVHGTTYPIVQGPMANVSDVARFSLKVAGEGGLPFVALSALPGPHIRELLEGIRNEMQDHPWGVGTLGFLPGALRREQFHILKEFHPSFAIIAGGRPSLAMAYEAEGISTYLHVPTPGLLNQFIKKGATKFIFEGRECGGHVGPLSSFSLWESTINTLLTNDRADPEQFQVLFAGGIHDSLSSAMVQTLAAPLAASGIKLGVIMGSAYLFSKEAVKQGAITPEYQKQALACDATHLLQSGIGHASSCMETPFVKKFYTKKQELILGGKTDSEIMQKLELMNLGRLKLASKGVSTSYKKSPGKDHVTHIQIEQTKVDDETQRNEGLFMIGQIAKLHDKTFSIKKLHTDVSKKSLSVLDASTQIPTSKGEATMEKEPLPVGKNEGIAIIGMASFLPEANSNKEYWQNILNKVCAIQEVPEDRWNVDTFFEPDRKSSEKSYSKWGGFLKDILFDPIKYAMAPKSLESIDPTQLLALKVAEQALEDAGYLNPGFPRKKTAVIFAAGGANNTGMDYGCRVMADSFADMGEGVSEKDKQKALKSFKDKLPEWSTDSFPGVLTNIIAGRISNRFDLGGMNFTCDAACASSFAAMDVAIRQLRTHACDAAIVGAVDTGNHPLGYLMFSRSQALSPTGKSRPLDDRADGIVLSEGTAALVLKRVTDAERDKDHIYAVIKGVGGGSDGRNSSLVVPNAEGQIRAMENAYEDAGILPESVELLELHATGTVLGDRVEVQSCREVFSGNGTKTNNHCAVGSVKSTIGHTKITAGLAAMIKTSLALEHKILPPTIGVETPNKKMDFASSPFYVNTEARPWLANSHGDARKAGLSCFGFGGSNFHVVMEEYARNSSQAGVKNLTPRDAEIFTFSDPTRAQLQKKVHHLLSLLQGVQVLDFSQLAYSVFLDSYQYQPEKPDCRLNIVASSCSDLENKLKAVHEKLKENSILNLEHQGIYYSEGSSLNESTDSLSPVCFLFPGQGSQRINMLRDLVLSMPETYNLIGLADKFTQDSYDQPLSSYIFPTPVFSDEDRRRQQKELNQTHKTQPSMGLMNLIAYDILTSFGIKPDMVAGHSYGEYVALCTAGVISRKDLIQLSESRGKMIKDFSQKKTGTMAAVQADSETTSRLIDTLCLDVSIANYNSPMQNVISGSVEAIEKAVKAIKAEGIPIRKIPVSAAFHTSDMDSISDSLEKILKKITLNKPDITVFSNATSLPYPETSDEIRHYIKQHGSEAVRFEKMIRNMYGAGARLFIEVGPGRVLTGLVKSILGDAPFSVVSMDAPGRSGWHQLSHLLAQVKTLGMPVDLSPCFNGRGLHPISTDDFMKKNRDDSNPGPMVWRIFGGRAEPYHLIKREKIRSHKKRIEEKTSIKNKIVPENRSGLSSLNQEAVVPPTIKQDKEHIMPSPKTTISSPINSPGFADNALLKVLDQCNKTMAHLFEMQSEQHRTTQQFLRIQESMIQTTLHGRINDSALELSPIAQQTVLSQHHLEQPNFVTQAVPPSPTLPRLEVPLQETKTKHTALSDDTPVTVTGGMNPENAAIPVTEIVAPPGVKGKASGHAVFPEVDEFAKTLITVTSEYTGFPEDMLDLTMNMEVELGVDSIKKLEIFSALDEKYSLTENADEEIYIEELAVITSLGGIIEWYERKRNEFLIVEK